MQEIVPSNELFYYKAMLRIAILYKTGMACDDHLKFQGKLEKDRDK
jgi:hypothetical protein